MSAERDVLPEAVTSPSSEESRALLALGRGLEPTTAAGDLLLRLRQNVMKWPEHPAILFEHERLSYRELMVRVGQLATRLRELGVQEGSRVAMFLQRGADEPVTMLAIWAVGGGYVPLDPSHPRERVQMILEDAAPEVLVTHSALVTSLALPEGMQLLELDRGRKQIAQCAPFVCTRRVDPAQLAYVLFTSGSTGRPKGVAVSRGAIANFLRSMAHTPGLDHSDRLLAVTTTTFDIAGLELLLPLWAGATVQIADRETALDGHKLRAVLERDPITIMQATPTTWRSLLEAGYGERGSQLRMLCGGEAMSPELAERLLATGGQLWNLYGPTETTVWSTLTRVQPNHPITIGRPIDATQIYLLSPELELVPRGEIGELCIGGAGLAQGYLNRPDLTRERFVPNPYGPKGDRLYRTGDLARWLANGELKCLGRIDHQVKIRGFRIELGEVESCIRRVQGVREVVVVADLRQPARPKLVAYWVGQADIQTLQSRVREALPSYMVPAAYVRLAKMPLNTNGKIDRNALPAHDARKAATASGPAPRNDAEMRMAVLFQAALRIDEVPVDEDFFALGGSSVELLELRESIKRDFGIELPLATLFNEPTVRRLVQCLGEQATREEPLFLELKAGRARTVPLVCLMGVTLYRDLSFALQSDQAVYGVHVPYQGAFRGVLPRVEQIAAKYVAAISERFPEGPMDLAGLCFGGVVAFEVARQLTARGRQVNRVVLFDAALPRAEYYDTQRRLTVLLESTLQRPHETLLDTARRLVHAGRRMATKNALRIAPYLPARLQAILPQTSERDSLPIDALGPRVDAMVEDYDRRAAPFEIEVILFRATDHTLPPWRRMDWDMGWSALTTQLQVHEVSGSHLEILRKPHVRRIAEVLHAGDAALGTTCA